MIGAAETCEKAGSLALQELVVLVPIFLLKSEIMQGTRKIWDWLIGLTTRRQVVARPLMRKMGRLE